MRSDRATRTRSARCSPPTRRSPIRARREGATPVLWAVYTRHPELAPLLLAGRPADFFEACALGDTARAAGL